jgi:integrase
VLPLAAPCDPEPRDQTRPEVASERLGHATVSTTLDTYSHAVPAAQEEAAALIAGLVFAAS